MNNRLNVVVRPLGTRLSWWRAWLLLLVALTGKTAAQAQKPPASQKPPFRLVRYEESYRSFADSARSLLSLSDKLKYLPLAGSGRPDVYLTLGGETRQLLEYFRNAGWSPAAGRDAYWLPRVFLHADLHLGPRLRLFGQVGSAGGQGRQGGPRPPLDEDRLFVHQAFGEWGTDSTRGPQLLVRAGRQELVLGSGRLVSFREFPNVRLSHDGLRLLLRRGAWAATAFALRPVENRRRVFDNPILSKAQSLWGLYGTVPLPSRLASGKLDLYYLGLERRQTAFNQGPGYELRHSVGTRWFGRGAAWDYNLEAVYQWGQFQTGRIRAWTASADVGHTWATARFRPRASLKADVISGDRNPTRPDLQTFNPLFPNPSYFSQSGLLGPANLLDVHPALEAAWTEKLTTKLNAAAFWRYSRQDGLYAPGGLPTRRVPAGAPPGPRYVGWLLEPEVRYRASRHVQAALIYTRFFAGPFLTDTSPAGRDVDFVDAYVTLTF